MGGVSPTGKTFWPPPTPSRTAGSCAHVRFRCERPLDLPGRGSRQDTEGVGSAASWEQTPRAEAHPQEPQVAREELVGGGLVGGWASQGSSSPAGCPSP